MNKLTGKKTFFIMAGILVALGIGNIASVAVGSAMLEKKAQKLHELKLKSRVLDDQQSTLSRAKKDIQTYTELEVIAKSAVPQDKDQAESVREIVKIASDNGIKLASVTFPASTLGQIAPKAAPAADGAAAPAAKPATTLTQVQPVDGIPGVYFLPINIQHDSASPVPYEKFISFLNALEQNRRTSQVNNVTVSPNTQDRSKLSFTLTVNAYIKP